jgi:geranylgeranyl diphosphate synthase type 3
VAHKIYGIRKTVNSATYTFSLAFQEVSALRQISGSAKACNLDALMTGWFSSFFVFLSTRTSEWFPDELISLHLGQGRELIWRDSLQCPSEEEYFQMASNSENASFSMFLSADHARNRRIVANGD